MLRRALWLRNALCASALTLAAGLPLAASGQTQVVYLNFDRFNPVTDIDFTPAERSQIQSNMEQDFALFDFQFVQSEPVSGDFSTLFFNDGPGFGIADGIDFRNVNRNDIARIQTTSGFPLTQDFVTFTANVASHELGHILGLRHRDSLGPIGSGFSDDPEFLQGTFGGGMFDTPNYTGPEVASSTIFHMMETSTSQTSGLTNDKFFGHREAIKLSFNERGTTVEESSLSNVLVSPFVQTPRQIELSNLEVPNTVELGDEARQLITVDAVAITGSISAALQKDYYAFEGHAGDLMSIEVAAEILGPDPIDNRDPIERYTEVIDARVSVYDSSGDLIPHFGGLATNSREFEGLPDAFLLDLVLPADDTYYIEVRSDISFDVGSYELFVHSFEAEQTPPGDFNLDGLVDAADYTIWRDTNGSTTDLRADADQNLKIDELDRDIWRNNLGLQGDVVVTPAHLATGVGPNGESLTSPLLFANASIPEPTTALLAVFGLVGCGLRRR